MLLGTLGASLLGILLSAKEIVRANSGNKKGKGIVRAGYPLNIPSSFNKLWNTEILWEWKKT